MIPCNWPFIDVDLSLRTDYKINQYQHVISFRVRIRVDLNLT